MAAHKGNVPAAVRSPSTSTTKSDGTGMGTPASIAASSTPSPGRPNPPPPPRLGRATTAARGAARRPPGRQPPAHGGQQAVAGGGDLVDGPREGLLVGLRRLAEAADLAHEPEGGGPHLLGRDRLLVSQGLDAPAHSRNLPPGLPSALAGSQEPTTARPAGDHHEGQGAVDEGGEPGQLGRWRRADPLPPAPASRPPARRRPSGVLASTFPGSLVDTCTRTRSPGVAEPAPRPLEVEAEVEVAERGLQLGVAQADQPAGQVDRAGERRPGPQQRPFLGDPEVPERPERPGGAGPPPRTASSGSSNPLDARTHVRPSSSLAGPSTSHPDLAQVVGPAGQPRGRRPPRTASSSKPTPPGPCPNRRPPRRSRGRRVTWQPVVTSDQGSQERTENGSVCLALPPTVPGGSGAGHCQLDPVPRGSCPAGRGWPAVPPVGQLPVGLPARRQVGVDVGAALER